jgi:hypothetical protein
VTVERLEDATCGQCGRAAQVEVYSADHEGWHIEREERRNDDGAVELVDVARVSAWKCPNPDCGAMNEVREEIQ